MGRVGFCILMVLVFVGMNRAQSQNTAQNRACRPGFDPMTAVLGIMRGTPVDSLRQFIAPDAVLVHGGFRMKVSDALESPDRSQILNEDSTRLGSMDLRPSDLGDALSVIVRTTNREGIDIHLHTVLLMRQPNNEWKIVLWHVGA
jgi:hypothetical protein